MNLANKLTLSRICLVPFFILFMSWGGGRYTFLALIIFFVASITDFFDGYIARKRKVITPLGIFLDPLADKLLISSAFVFFTGIAYLEITAWMVIVIISREFLITGFRSIAAYKNVIIPADKSGKFKTTLQIVVIITTLIIIIINEEFARYLCVPIDSLKYHNIEAYSYMIVIMKKIPYWFVFLTVIFTIFSGVNYVVKYKKLLDFK